MKTRLMSWLFGVIALLSSISALAETSFHEEGFIDALVTAPADTTYTFYLGSGGYTLDLADYQFPEAFLPGSLGVSISSGGDPIANFTGEGSYSLLGITEGSYTFYVYGDANNGVGIGSFGLTVTPVPEPNTALLLLVGMGLVGRYAQKRRVTPAFSNDKPKELS